MNKILIAASVAVIVGLGSLGFLLAHVKSQAAAADSTPLSAFVVRDATHVVAVLVITKDGVIHPVLAPLSPETVQKLKEIGKTLPEANQGLLTVVPEGQAPREGGTTS